MDKGGGPALAGDARWRVVEARVEERARRRRDQPEWPLGIAVVDHVNMVCKSRQPRTLAPDRPPIGAEVEFLVDMRETVQEMAGLERRTTVEPASFRKFRHARQPANSQCLVDQLDRTHREAG